MQRVGVVLLKDHDQVVQHGDVPVEPQVKRSVKHRGFTDGGGGQVPVYTGLGVSDLVETGDLEAVCVPSLAFVHEVAKGQDHLQDLVQPPAANHLP